MNAIPEQDPLEVLREQIFAGNNRYCFVEREQLLPKLTEAAQSVPPELRYSSVLAELLAQISTPVDPHDVILGRMVEGSSGMSDEEVDATRWQDFCHQEMLIGPGHLTLDWEALLAHGLNGIAQQARATAERLGTDEAKVLAENAAICAEAVEAFAKRYAAAARVTAEQQEGRKRDALLRAAAALEVVPHGPAPDLFSALQGIWLINLITSCIIGGRDYAFGRMDQYLLPFYERDLAEARLDREQAIQLVAHFLMKCNEIPSTASHHYKDKLIPCAGTKQYLILGGSDVNGGDCSNELSHVILDAEARVALTQPVVIARLAESTNEDFLRHACDVTLRSQGLVQFMNDRMVIPGLLRRGVAPEDACDYTARGCSTIDLAARTGCHTEMFNLTPWLIDLLNGESLDGVTLGEAQSVDEILNAMGGLLHKRMAKRLRDKSDYPEPYWECSFRNDGGPHFHFDALLMRDCVETGRLYCQGGSRYVLRIVDFGSLATIADSLMTIQRLVFDEKRFTLAELMTICMSDFAGHEALRQEILNKIPKFGNDDAEVDGIAEKLCSVVCDALDAVELPPKNVLLPAVFTLINHNKAGERLPATPDGRRAGEPLSENQSPTHGADRAGLTALFKSLGRLPFERMPSGGLNVKFACRMEPETLASLLRTYFAQAGAIVGFTFVNRSMLEDARRHPERYRSLMVRQTGFSEYFNAMPPHEQLELIERSEY